MAGAVLRGAPAFERADAVVLSSPRERHEWGTMSNRIEGDLGFSPICVAFQLHGRRAVP